MTAPFDPSDLAAQSHRDAAPAALMREVPYAFVRGAAFDDEDDANPVAMAAGMFVVAYV
ncbi:MAG: hypothetical protein GDA40_05970 [Rhodobacteraceae bacterium]|nr:hypothetical protein [Paracoccaceae bacterium]